MISKKKTFRPFYFILIVVSLFYVFNFQKSGNSGGGFKTCIHSDGSGYYAYLPAIFIYHDLTFGFINSLSQKYPGTGLDDFATNKTAETHFNKYFPGEAILLIPFFLIGCLLSYISGNAVDGYSFYFQVSVAAAALFYFLMGCLYAYRFSNILTKKPIISAFSVLTFAFGTNLFYYTFYESAMSHTFSFSLISIWCYCLALLKVSIKDKYILTAGVVLGLIILTRPVNGIVILLLPIIAANFSEFSNIMRTRVSAHLTYLILSVLISILIISLQFINNWLQSGQIIFNSYGNENFCFLNPKIFEVLFGFRKGLFIYTPLVFISFIGLPVLFYKSKWLFGSIFLTIVLFVYITSSWYCWPYGGSFGMRPFVDFYAIFIFLFVVFMAWIKNALMYLFLFFIALIISFNLFQTFQYRNGILSYDNMNFQRYKRILFSTDLQLKDIFVRHPASLNEEKIKLRQVFNNNFDTDSIKSDFGNITKNQFFSHPFCRFVDSTDLNNPPFQFQFNNKAIVTQYSVFIKISCMVKSETNIGNSYLNIETINKESQASIETYPLLGNITEANKWQLLSVIFIMPSSLAYRDMVKVYFSSSKNRIYYDNLKIELLYCDYLADL